MKTIEVLTNKRNEIYNKVVGYAHDMETSKVENNQSAYKIASHNYKVTDTILLSLDRYLGKGFYQNFGESDIKGVESGLIFNLDMVSMMINPPSPSQKYEVSDFTFELIGIITYNYIMLDEYNLPLDKLLK